MAKMTLRTPMDAQVAADALRRAILDASNRKTDSTNLAGVCEGNVFTIRKLVQHSKDGDFSWTRLTGRFYTGSAGAGTTIKTDFRSSKLLYLLLIAQGALFASLICMINQVRVIDYSALWFFFITICMLCHAIKLVRTERMLYLSFLEEAIGAKPVEDR